LPDSDQLRKKREAQARWRAANIERAREIARLSYARNREKAKARAAAYRVAHRDERLRKRRLSERGETFNARRRANRDTRYNHARRVRLRGAVAVSYTRTSIFDRDLWTCQLCGDPVNPDLRFPHRLSASIDHVVPVARGGSDTPENVQLAHLSCNASKRAAA